MPTQHVSLFSFSGGNNYPNFFSVSYWYSAGIIVFGVGKFLVDLLRRNSENLSDMGVGYLQLKSQ